VWRTPGQVVRPDGEWKEHGLARVGCRNSAHRACISWRPSSLTHCCASFRSAVGGSRPFFGSPPKYVASPGRVTRWGHWWTRIGCRSEGRTQREQRRPKRPWPRPTTKGAGARGTRQRRGPKCGLPERKRRQHGHARRSLGSGRCRSRKDRRAHRARGAPREREVAPLHAPRMQSSDKRAERGRRLRATTRKPA